MSGLRVALDLTPLLGSPTGVGAFVRGAAGALAERDDLEVSGFALTWKGRGTLDAVAPPGVRVHHRPMAARPLREAWKRMAFPAIEAWTGPIDVVHGTNFVVPPARRAARVVTVHDLTPVRYPELCQADTLAYPALIARAVEQGAWVHTPTEYVAEEVRDEFDVEPGRVVAVAHGVPGADTLAGADAVRGREMAGAERYVLALGTVEPRKDLVTLVQAFAALPADARDGVRLVIAGPDGWGSEALAAALDALPAGVRESVTRIGYVAPPERDGLLAGAAVFAYPSLYEGFGLPPLEAMTAGVPVVATAAGPLPEVLGDAATLVPVNDVDALAGALAAALALDGAERAAVVTAGRERAAGFTWLRCADGLSGIYHRAAAARTR